MKRSTFMLTCSGLALSGTPSFAFALRGSAGDLAVETSAFMQHSAYRNVAHMDRDTSPDGAHGSVNQSWDATREGRWYIEEQRYGADLVAGGIAVDDADAIERGMRILSWGFAQQGPDGGFPCPDAFHSTSFFVEASAHALLLLEASKDAAQFARTIAEMKPKLLRAARWMTDPRNELPGKRGNTPYTHRRYLVAAALGETGVLVRDGALIEHSVAYAREGTALQDSSGYNPERGGWDNSYQAVGMLFACRYAMIVANDELRTALFAMLRRAEAWEASRINDDGSIRTDGNTRVGGVITENGRSGKPKTLAVGQVYRTFYYWSVLSGNPSYETLAEKVARAGKQWGMPRG